MRGLSILKFYEMCDNNDISGSLIMVDDNLVIRMKSSNTVISQTVDYDLISRNWAFKRQIKRLIKTVRKGRKKGVQEDGRE